LIEFEISESVMMGCGATALGHLAALRRAGATIAIDDFGSGSSSLARLRTMPFDTIKLDVDMIAEIEGNEVARGVVQAVIGLIHSFGAKAVAQGVDTAGQYEILRVMGCDGAQGHAIAPPMTVADYRVWAGNMPDRMRA